VEDRVEGRSHSRIDFRTTRRWFIHKEPGRGRFCGGHEGDITDDVNEGGFDSVVVGVRRDEMSVRSDQVHTFTHKAARDVYFQDRLKRCLTTDSGRKPPKHLPDVASALLRAMLSRRAICAGLSPLGMHRRDYLGLFGDSWRTTLVFTVGLALGRLVLAHG
jgi:hypothetical protein